MLFYLPCFFWGQSLIFVQLSSTTFCIEIYIHFSGLFLHISHNNIDMQHITIRMFIFWLLTNQFSSVAQLCPTLWDPMDCSMPGFLAHHQFPEHTQTHDHRLGDAIQPSHPLSPSPPAFNLSQHQGLFKWVSSLHQVTKVLEFQLQHQSFQWIFRTNLL